MAMEKILFRKGLNLAKGTASHYHQHGFRKTDPRAIRQAWQGRVMEWTTKMVKKKLVQSFFNLFQLILYLNI